MNLLYGEIVDVLVEDGLPFARLRVGGAMKKISVALLRDVAPGDTVLVCDGMAIAKVEEGRKENNVSGNTR